jgi:hypothetical protein
MSRSVSMLGLAMTALVGSPAFSQAAPQSVALPIAPNQTDVSKIVCERQDEIGSRLKGKKVCLTVEQWKVFKNQSRDDVEEMQRHANTARSN